jgi:hypothetical protein
MLYPLCSPGSLPEKGRKKRGKKMRKKTRACVAKRNESMSRLRSFIKGSYEAEGKDKN